MPLRAELACKPFVFQEAYETVRRHLSTLPERYSSLAQLLYIMLPFMTFSSLWADWKQTLLYSGAVIGGYPVNPIWNVIDPRV
jgi:hypothetical protein